MSLEIGCRVLLLDFDERVEGQVIEERRVEGQVKFFGLTKFAPGVWIGVQLDAAEGLNNGSIDGVHYFSCEPKYGVFVRHHTVVRLVGIPQTSTGVGKVKRNALTSDGRQKFPTTSHPPPTVTPTKVGSVSKQVGGRRKENFVNHFCFNRKESIKAIEHFNKFGFVKLDPNPSFKAHTRLLVQRLVDEALKLDKTLDEMLRLHVDEKMSSALGDRLRMMKHETTYPTRHRHKEFFDIMRELNLYFIAGNESALRMLTSNLQQRDESLHVFHERTEVLDIITLPGAKNQNEHLDAFFEKVK